MPKNSVRLQQNKLLGPRKIATPIIWSHISRLGTMALVLFSSLAFAPHRELQGSGIQLNGPAGATRWENGASWNEDGTIDDLPTAGPINGIVRCGSSAETQAQLKHTGVYQSDQFLISLPANTCVEPSSGAIVNPTPPTEGQPVIWFNFDVRAYAGEWEVQVNDNARDNVAWALFYSEEPTSGTSPSPATGQELSGNPNKLSLALCGVESASTWNSLPVPAQSQPTNYYLAIWDQDADGDVQLNNFKARKGCGPTPWSQCAVASCTEEVWGTSTGNGTCGDHISWVRANSPAHAAWPAACAFVAWQPWTPECAPCAPPAPPPPAPPPSPPPAWQACGVPSCTAAVWDTPYEQGTCGEQIRWVQGNLHDHSSWPAACTYVARQAHTSGCAPCGQPAALPPTPPPPPPSPPPAWSVCGCSRAVWDTLASNNAGTCGQQISWVKDNVPGHGEWSDACAYVAWQSFTPECAPCGPPAPHPPPSPSPPTSLSYCSSWGDPHMVTFNQEKYDHMGVGSFEVLNTPSLLLRVQSFQCPQPAWVAGATANVALAARIGEHTVVIVGEELLLFNGSSAAAQLSASRDDFDDGQSVTVDSIAGQFHVKNAHGAWRLEGSEFLLSSSSYSAPPSMVAMGHMMDFKIGLKPSLLAAGASTGLCTHSCAATHADGTCVHAACNALQPADVLINSVHAALYKLLTEQCSANQSTDASRSPCDPPTSAEACEHTGFLMADALAACAPLQSSSKAYDACLYDCCSTGLLPGLGGGDGRAHQGV
ncbi:hypothetical protein AB1Y20_012101 [Prymnesium parvum]|uniref:VWFD domain-containing protein n=1 Tax=Prymnesium parvum TaxID=97485 RepID=A0AB34INT4_PRYPA